MGDSYRLWEDVMGLFVLTNDWESFVFLQASILLNLNIFKVIFNVTNRDAFFVKFAKISNQLIE